MSRNYMSVWCWDYPKRYYLTHPWRWFRELGWNIRNAHRRATKGYCDIDWMNFDTWFKHIAPLMLRDMATHGHAYPGSEPFDTPEQWRSWLHRMADQIIKCQDEDYGNEYAKPYLDALMKKNTRLFDFNKTEEDKELFEKYYNRSLEVAKEQKELFKSTMLEMLEHWDCLWD